jgi:2-phosphosulfolactate phosphatase
MTAYFYQPNPDQPPRDLRNTMHLKVDLIPRGPYQGVVIVVDVLRATTTTPLLFEKGMTELFITASLRAAREYAAQGQHLLLGERDGLPPEGFNYGASPADLAKFDFSGKTAVMTTQNGPKTLPIVASAHTVLFGSFYNAQAVSDAALEIALNNNLEEIAIVCAGQEGLEGLDDTLTAGFLAKRIERNFNAKNIGKLAHQHASQLAVHLLRAFPDPQEALVLSAPGQLLQKLNLHEDIAFSSLISQTNAVPVLREVIPWQPSAIYRFENLTKD